MKKIWIGMGIAGLSLLQLVYADWQNEYNNSQGSAEALKERAAQEFFLQDHGAPPSQPSYHSARIYHHQVPNKIRPNENIEDEGISSKGLPSHISTNEKVIIVDPVIHEWGAYSANGKLIHSGLATAGARWCADIGRPCKTKSGVFRIYSLGSEECISSIYPIEEGGGAPMPYCMYFNGSQGLHGSDHVVQGNISHGCVRLRVSDAQWLRYHFVTQGTKIIIKPY